MRIELPAGWAWGVWVNEEQDWLRDESDAIRRFDSEDAAERFLRAARFVNTTRVDWKGSAYVGQVAPEST